MSTETIYTYEVVDLRPAADGWSVREACISSDGDVTFETLPLAGWGVVERYVADRGHNPVTPTGVRRVSPVVWDADYGCLLAPGGTGEPRRRYDHRADRARWPARR